MKEPGEIGPHCEFCHERLNEMESILGATRCGRCQMARDIALEQMKLALKLGNPTTS